MIEAVEPPKGRQQYLWDSCESRSVTPNTRSYDNDRSIIAITGEEVYLERTGCVVSHDTFVNTLETEPRSLVVTYGAESLLLRLHTRHQSNPRWQWKVSVSGDTLLHKKVAYFGFRRRNGIQADRRHIYHVVVDINSFYRIHQWEDRHDLQKLIRLGNEVRDFCREYNLEIRPTAAGLANQLLRHPMFYPEPRRQVPKFINDEARKHLPGNHYSVYTSVGQKVESAIYIDQQAAHHHAAGHTPLPNANSIAVQGCSRRGKAYARKRSHPNSLYQKLRKVHGLYEVWAYVPHIHPRVRKYAPKCIVKRDGLQKLWLWSNEIDYIESFGVEIRYIISVWGSSEVDDAMPRYAKWAIETQEQYPWLKQVTLMTYGLLAKRPEGYEVYYHQGNPDKRSTFVLANEMVEGSKCDVHVVSPTANVLQRGLIESYVRSLSLDTAKQCADQGHEVISIYADGIFLRTAENAQLPLTIPWREKGKVTDLEFECATRFRSNELVRFPGTARFRKDYVAAA